MRCHLLGFRDHGGMMNMMAHRRTVKSDEELWRQARGGDREAFADIVERYQTLVCSIAYSACGDVVGSEDLAQEAFLVAWERMAELRNPTGLRPWLCGIVRKLAANAARRYFRRGGSTQTLDVIENRASEEHDPAVAAVRREEEMLVQRSLRRLPEAYREPLVLFYREDRSVAEVARWLDLSEDTVRQRLLRGRAMLREELSGVVGRTLRRTRPGPGFTSAVLAGLAALAADGSGKAMAAGATTMLIKAAGSPGALAKGSLGMFWGPAIGFFTSWLAIRALRRTARSKTERRLRTRHAAGAIAWTLGMCGLLVAWLSQAGTLYAMSGTWLTLGVLVWTAVLVVVLHAIGSRMNRVVDAHRQGLPGRVCGPLR